MKVIKSVSEALEYCKAVRLSGKKIGFVPTMGSLHQGHLSLIRIAREKSDFIVVSIFVNPTQFGPGEDFEKYPRNYNKDEFLCKKENVDLIFYPSRQAMYPENYKTYIITEDLAQKLCGVTRPDHFRGVTTIVAKLFNIIIPHCAVFGQKDAQQSIIIRRMVEDLNYDINIITAPIIREQDGLALSSRNKYLSMEERSDAPVLFQSLHWAQQKIEHGLSDTSQIIKGMRDKIAQKTTARIDYIEIVDPVSLQKLDTIKDDALIALAVYIGQTRLIDNIHISKTGVSN